MTKYRLMFYLGIILHLVRLFCLGLPAWDCSAWSCSAWGSSFGSCGSASGGWITCSSWLFCGAWTSCWAGAGAWGICGGLGICTFKFREDMISAWILSASVSWLIVILPYILSVTHDCTLNSTRMRQGDWQVQKRNTYQSNSRGEGG